MKQVPVFRRTEAQAEAGPLMLMVRRANMGLSIAAGRRIAKPCGTNFTIPESQTAVVRFRILAGAAGPDFR
jgi:hypothetical protein